MGVGFIHGVMNTDNMTISGETIDYGPCAFMDSYSSGTVFSSIDTQGRYAYSNQPSILSWNLTRLAETLVPLVDKNQDQAVGLLTAAIQNIRTLYESHWLSQMRSKIGLTIDDPLDKGLIESLLLIMEEEQADFTLVFRRLAAALQDNEDEVRKLFKDPASFDSWRIRWQERLAKEDNTKESVIRMMNKTNPIYIARNHKVEEVLSSAIDQKDIKPFLDFLLVLETPFDEVEGSEDYAVPGPDSDIPYQTFCGT